MQEISRKGKSKNVNIMKIIFLCISIVIIIFLYEQLIKTNFINKELKIIFIPLSDMDYRTYLNTVWQVQTSISILTITFITLVLNKLDYRILGFKLNEIISISESIS